MNPPPAATHVYRHDATVTRSERFRLLRTSGATLWLTGLSGSGKSTIAVALEHELLRHGVRAYRLDGDNLRTGINRALGFLPEHRTENIRRIAEIARLFADSGAIAIVSAISPMRADRAAARRLHDEDSPSPLTFLEVFVNTPLSTCESRDPKGLYKKARAGEISGFTGVDSPYEPPLAPELFLPTAILDVDACVHACVQLLGQTRASPGSSTETAS